MKKSASLMREARFYSMAFSYLC